MARNTFFFYPNKVRQDNAEDYAVIGLEGGDLEVCMILKEDSLKFLKDLGSKIAKAIEFTEDLAKKSQAEI